MDLSDEHRNVGDAAAAGGRPVAILLCVYIRESESVRIMNLDCEFPFTICLPARL